MWSKFLQGVKAWGTLVSIILVIVGGAVAYGGFQEKFSSIEKDLEPLAKLPEAIVRLETTETELGRRMTRITLCDGMPCTTR